MYTPNVDMWKKHFEYMANGNAKRHKDFYIVRKAQTGSGASPLVMVSPVQADVERAKDDLKGNKEDNIGTDSYVPPQSVAKPRTGKIKKPSKRKPTKRKSSKS